MLFAKDFKTALAVVIASVGLLSVGTVNAQVHVYLGAPADDSDTSTPAVFAAEMDLADDNGHVISQPSTTLETEWQAVDVALLNNDRIFVRIDVENATFGSGFADVANKVQVTYDADNDGLGTGTDDQAPLVRVSGGRAGEATGIWSFEVDTTGTSGLGVLVPTVGSIVPAGGWNLEIDSLRFNGFRVPDRSLTEETEVSLMVRLYDNIGEATTAGDDADVIKSASGVVLKFVPTLDGIVSVTAGPDLTASVASQFRRFLVETGGATSATNNLLATVDVAVKVQDGDTMIQKPDGTGQVTPADVLESVAFTLTGDTSPTGAFEFGEFTAGDAAMDRYEGDDEVEADEAGEPAGRAKTDSVRTTLEGPALADSIEISIDVTANTATSDYEQIGEGSYELAWEVNAVADDADPAGGSMDVASIERDGTTVRLAYLSTAAGADRTVNDTVGSINQTWNQRLLITNHSNVMAAVVLSNFAAGEGVTVACMPDDADEPMWTCNTDGDEVMANVGPDQQLVLRVQDVLMITGGSRTAAHLTAEVDKGSISVATTHVTLPLGTTDTVVYWPLNDSALE